MKRPPRIYLLLVAAVLSMGVNTRCERARASNQVCLPISVTVPPGTCTTITNPCADFQWIPRGDGFSLLSPVPAGVSITTTHSGGTTTRAVCAAANADLVVNQLVPVMYRRLGDDDRTGVMVLSTVARLVVGVAASPATISAGGTSHLEARGVGGFPPYRYDWTPAAGLSATDIANPDATPSATTAYIVSVLDARGAVASASVTVTVEVSQQPTITVSATPPRINQSESSRLSVGGLTGVAPFAYAWSPGTALDNPSSAAPTATPDETTTYTVSVSDSTGVTVSGSATVIVNISLFVGAVPEMINQGQPTQLFASAQGGLPPYVYQWAPLATVSDPTSAFPTATPISTTTYSALVTDSLGATASGTVIVFVAPTGGGGSTGAPFTFTYDGVGTITLNATESASTAVRFDWDFSWVPGNPDLTTTTPQATWVAPPGTTGTITLTVTDAAGQQRSTTRTFP